MKAVLASAIALLVGTGAQASPFVFDDFATAQSVVDSSADGAAEATSMTFMASGASFTRTIGVDQSRNSSADGSLSSTADIGAGRLAISNEGDANATFELTYGIDAFEGRLPSNLQVDLLVSELSEESFIDIAAYLNGSLIETRRLTRRGGAVFALDALEGSGDLLRLVFSGSDGFDATIDPLAVVWPEGEPNPVPEPGAAALLGLGLLGIAGLRRRTTSR
jgi:hypothetical protein